MINFEKSELEPTHKIDFLGYHFDLLQGKSLSNRKEVENSRKSCSGHGDRITNNPKVARLLMSLIGVLASLEKTIPMGRLHMRPFQWYLKTNWQYPQSLDLKIPVSNFLKSHLQWWEDPKNLKNGLSFSSTGTQYPYFHKCIKSRLGSSFSKHDSQWQLDRSGEITSYQCPRVKGSVSGLKKLSNRILDKSVLIATDNATVVSYLNKQGGTHSWDMCLLVWHILAYCNPRNILIRARHIQGCLNVIADSLSRKDKIIQTEWSLHPQIFSLICIVWHKPMFATKLNHKLPIYVSPVPDSNAVNIDALNISWEGLDGYAFCPVTLIPKVIQKMYTYRCRMIVVAPGWPRMLWFLVNLSTKPHYNYLTGLIC